MVLQDYGASVLPIAMDERTGPKFQRKALLARFGLISVVCLAVVTVLAVGAFSVVTSSSEELLDESLSQHLMSQFSRYSNEMKADDDIYTTEGHSKPASFHPWTGDDSSAFNQLKDISTRPVDEAEHGISDVISKDTASHHSWYGKWGSDGSESRHSNWDNQLKSMQAKAAARRKQEDEKYFSGVYKVLGKAAGQRMMAAFEGKKVKGLNKIKIDESVLAKRKDAIAHNNELPKTQHAAQQKGKHTAQAKQALVAKHTAASSSAASQPSAHKAAPVSKSEDKVAAKAAVKEKAKAKPRLTHPGVIADARKIKQLVHEFRHAKGKKRKMLKARVMKLKEDIVNDFDKVTAFGKRAKTAFQRAEAKEKHKGGRKADGRHGGEGDRHHEEEEDRRRDEEEEDD